MLKTVKFNLILALLLPAVLMAQKLPKPSRAPAVPTQHQRTLTAEGLAYHDAGRYDEAIEKYKRVLDEAPEEVSAMYEMAFSYAAKKDCATAMELARRGAQYRSKVLPQFHLLLGNCLDDLGRPIEAMDVYKDAINISPDFALLHFNLGLAEMRLDKNADARKSFQQALLLDPNHPSSHYLLANVYNALGYRVPAVLALSRFLMLEPESRRADEALELLNQLLGGGVAKGEKPNEINVTLALSPKSRKDEGDFDSVSLVLSLSLAASQVQAKGTASPFKRLGSMYAVMGDALSRTKGKGFAVSYYAPFFAQIEQKGFVEPFLYRALNGAQVDGAEEWSRESRSKLDEFESWSKSYRWPRK
jgi:tetratricopeptide (TPR) repeat protein